MNNAVTFLFTLLPFALSRPPAALLQPLTPLPISVNISPSGAFSVHVNGSPTPYFTSAPTYFRANGALFSTADGTLTLAAPPSPPTPGVDALGAFTRQELRWVGAGGSAPPFTTAVLTYAALGAVVFEQVFPLGANGTAAPGAGAGDAVLSAWPAIALDPADTARGAVAFGGRAFLEGSRPLAWGSAGAGLPSAGGRGGPLVLFDLAPPAAGAPGAAVALSSLTQHAVATSSLDAAPAPGALSYGVLGTVASLPPGFSVRTILAATAGGATAGMVRWGGLLRAHAGLGERPADPTLDLLGYATANGAYYYYKPGVGPDGKDMTYEDTLLEVVAVARNTSIPIQWLQLDSWWYTRGAGGGVENWTATSTTFPHGLKWFHEQVGMPFVAHNRYWAADNVYATQNGGGFAFDVELDTQMSIPLEQRFWDELLQNASEWGMIQYEQDWL